jgi:hypothetical protein
MLNRKEGATLSSANHDTAPRGLREWWASPPRSGLQRVINPWEYRHLRFAGGARLAGGIIGLGLGLFILTYAAYGWAALFLVLGALNLAGGYWYISIAGSARHRP